MGLYQFYAILVQLFCYKYVLINLLTYLFTYLLMCEHNPRLERVVTNLHPMTVMSKL